MVIHTNTCHFFFYCDSVFLGKIMDWFLIPYFSFELNIPSLTGHARLKKPVQPAI